MSYTYTNSWWKKGIIIYNTCQRTGTYLKMRISLQLCKKKNGFDTYYHFFFTKKQLPSFTASEQSDMLFNFFLKKIGIFFFLIDLYIYICVWINFWREREKKHNNYSILIIICTDDTQKQMNHTTTVFYQFISQSIYLPVFVGVFLN